MNARTIPCASADPVELGAMDAETLASLFQAATTDEYLKGLMPTLRDEICRRWMGEQPPVKFVMSRAPALTLQQPATSASTYPGA